VKYLRIENHLKGLSLTYEKFHLVPNIRPKNEGEATRRSQAKTANTRHIFKHFYDFPSTSGKAAHICE